MFIVDNMDEKIEIMLDKKFDEIIAKHFSPLKESLETVKSSLNFHCSQYDKLVGQQAITYREHWVEG